MLYSVKRTLVQTFFLRYFHRLQKALLDGTMEAAIKESVSKVSPVRTVMIRRSQLLQSGVVVEDGPTLDEIHAEEKAAEFVKTSVTKPVVGFIAGRTAPPGKRMGHAGAIISGGMGTADAKVEAMKNAGITVAENPALIGQSLSKVLGR